MRPKSFSTKIILALALTVAACGGGKKEARVPHSDRDLALGLSEAFREEAAGDPVKAAGAYVDVLDRAGASPDAGMSVHVAMAVLDALVHHDYPAFTDSTSSSALADRVDPEALKKSGGTIDERLARAEARAEGPFIPALIAEARLALAERRGDAQAAARERARTGCAREADVVGPVAWMTVSGSREEPSVKSNGPMPSELAGPGPFLPKLRPLKVRAFGCFLPLYAETSVLGVREVAVDVAVPKAGTIGVGIRASSEAVLHAGGVKVVERAHAMGGRRSPRFARVESTAGTLRLVARVGMDQDFESVQIGAWDADGRPLATSAPNPGSKATATVKRAIPVVAPPPKNDAERLAVALGDLAGNDARHAENLLSPEVSRLVISPDILLVYARAIMLSRDLPVVKAQERARSMYERVIDTMPLSWEAVLEHAVLAGARRGRAEANIEALADLDQTRAKTKTAAPALLDAYEAATAGREHLYDRARQAYERLGGTSIARTLMLSELDRVVFTRTGKDLVGFDCGDHPRDRTSLACHNALVAAGERALAEKELERLRALAETPQLYLSLSTRSAIEASDLDRARKLLDMMNPGDRALSSTYAVKGKASTGDLLRLAPTARDAPGALPSLLRDAGDDPLAAFDAIADKAVSDAGSANIANAATAVLEHRERYEVEDSGLVHYTMFDVRRVMGTTDVEANAQASAPLLYGKDAVRVLRRRIFKKDGRVVLPDRTPHAAQSHADLSQLEAGDAVEAIYEGWGLPNETGNVGIDTPDLLPERTAVRDAVIELRLPTSIKGSLWSHPMLGKAEESSERGKRILVWRVKDRPVRRLESGVPKMDRNVGVSYSTTTWADVARGLRETITSLEAESPEVSAWAREASGLKGKEPVTAANAREVVEKVVTASGQAVKEATGTILSDLDIGRAGGHGMTARGILATREGSRTWLIVDALNRLGVKTDIAVAENDPFSDSASFPPHFGRFMHPLAIAHVPDPQKPTTVTDVWIDADVPGPPLPAGRISPELRGRNALYPDGRIEPLPSVAKDSERDEVDIRLAVDDDGNAKGTMTVLLRGHTAQDLAEALVRLTGLERQRALRGIALGWVPFATVEKVELSSSEGSWQVAIRADLTAPAYAQVEGTKPETRTWILPGMDPVHYLFPRPFVTTLSSTYASQAARESALAINHATQYHVRRRVELPTTAKIMKLPGPFEGKGPLLTASRKISVAGSSIEEDFTLDVTTGTVPLERYDEFVAAAHQADDAFRASTRAKPSPK